MILWASEFSKKNYKIPFDNNSLSGYFIRIDWKLGVPIQEPKALKIRQNFWWILPKKRRNGLQVLFKIFCFLTVKNAFMTYGVKWTGFFTLERTPTRLVRPPQYCAPFYKNSVIMRPLDLTMLKTFFTKVILNNNGTV